jgi:hypothetical protein
MNDELIFVVVGLLIIALGILILISKIRNGKETDTFGKASRGQLIVFSITLILAGLILIFKNV